jgi:hypothetical protein
LFLVGNTGLWGFDFFVLGRGVEGEEQEKSRFFFRIFSFFEYEV